MDSHSRNASPTRDESTAADSDSQMPSFDDTVDSTLHKETLPSFEVPNISAEDSIISLPIKGVAASPQQVEYNIVHKGSLCGGNLLVDNFGFSFTHQG